SFEPHRSAHDSANRPRPSVLSETRMTAWAIPVVLAIAASSDAQQAARDPSSSIAWTAYRSESGDRSQIAALEALVPALLGPGRLGRTIALGAVLDALWRLGGRPRLEL